MTQHGSTKVILSNKFFELIVGLLFHFQNLPELVIRGFWLEEGSLVIARRNSDSSIATDQDGKCVNVIHDMDGAGVHKFYYKLKS